jgi:hypothetical protein
MSFVLATLNPHTQLGAWMMSVLIILGVVIVALAFRLLAPINALPLTTESQPTSLVDASTQEEI